MLLNHKLREVLSMYPMKKPNSGPIKIDIKQKNNLVFNYRNVTEANGFELLHNSATRIAQVYSTCIDRLLQKIYPILKFEFQKINLFQIIVLYCLKYYMFIKNLS